MKKLLTAAVLTLVMAIAQGAMAQSLVDVPETHWAADAVQRLVDSGIVQGYPDGSYKGDKPMTRYEYAMVVDRMMKLIDETYCEKEECDKEVVAQGGNLSEEDLEEIRNIVKKLATEFKDELAALKVKVDENSERIAKVEEDIKQSRIGNIRVNGTLRQRVDVAQTDLSDADFANRTEALYGLPAGSLSDDGVDTGYEMYAYLEFTGSAGDNVDFLIGLEKAIWQSPMGDAQGSQLMNAGTEENGELVINAAYVDTDFSESVRELDLFNIRSGYQQFDFGPYGMLVDNSGVTSNPAVRFDFAKDIVSLTAIGALADVRGSALNGTGGGASVTDEYYALRLGLDLPWLYFGANFLADGMDSFIDTDADGDVDFSRGGEKGWGIDIVAPILSDSPFLKELRVEYMTVTDLDDGSLIGTGVDDDSFIVGLDVYKSERAGLTFSYADIPAAVALSGLDVNPFTEFDNTCPLGLDIAPTGGCYSFESDSLFVQGFEGIGVEASYIVLGDVTLAGKVVVGNYAGGTRWGQDLDGMDYPGFGAISVSKPVTESADFRVEYMQQGKDPVALSRVRGELVISF